MDLVELENIANNEKIVLAKDNQMKKKSKIINLEKTTCIFMNYSKISTQRQEKCLLAEELRALLL